MIGILHGYLLEGSGSNLWTRSIIQALCRQGEKIHLFCQENHPEKYDFISEVYIYEDNGSINTLLKRSVPYKGECIMHKPKLGDVLPVFVWDHYEEFKRVVPMIDLSDQEIDFYINRYINVLKTIINEFEIKVLHANHAVLMSVIAQKIYQLKGIPYAVMPHGSGIEYAVKKDERFFNYAKHAFEHAEKLFVIGPEIQQRINGIFSSIPNIQNKMTELNLGVDTSLFTPKNKNERKQNINQMIDLLSTMDKGKSPDQSEQLIQEYSSEINLDVIVKKIKKYSHYTAKLPDSNIKEKFQLIDWKNENTILFVGRLIASKGLQSIIASLPDILEKSPNTRLIVVGHGPQREVIEILLHTLQTGNLNLFEKLIEWGSALEGGPDKSYDTIKHFLKNKNINSYLKKSQKFLNKDSVIFTGYLTHRELCYLFPCCDVAIFPSVVAEAGPLVFLEALASGCFPMGTYFAGMAASIDSVSSALQQNHVEYMKISHDESKTVNNIVTNVSNAFEICEQYKFVLRNIAVKKYDWQNVAKKLSKNLKSLINN